ncbi:uncharacterized protein [Aristolochia californica]|uniref:uncharacterized protein n=1 Tax=Aristolochia californica TaxID=171875 RepID=UPI0035DD8E81
MKKGKQDLDEKEKAEILNADHNAVTSEDLDPVDQGSNGDIKGPTISGNNSNVASLCPIPPATLIKQLPMAVEVGRKYRSTSDVLMSTRDSERTGISFSAMKALVLRDKEDKVASTIDDKNEMISLIHFLFDVEEESHTKACSCLKNNRTVNLPREVHGASLGSFVFRLSKIMANFKSLHKMASFWQSVIEEVQLIFNAYYSCPPLGKELRRLWYQRQPVPQVPLDEIPELNYTLASAVAGY